MKKTLYLMRHGQTLFNARKKIQGWCDAPLRVREINRLDSRKEIYLQNNNIVFDLLIVL